MKSPKEGSNANRSHNNSSFGTATKMQSNMLGNECAFNICDCNSDCGDFNPGTGANSQLCFTHYGCPSDMNGQHTPSGGAGGYAGHSRIPRGAARPRQALSPRINHSFLPVFHERTKDEDSALLTDNLWKLARKTGNLNLTNKGMSRVVTESQVNRWKYPAKEEIASHTIGNGVMDSSALWFMYMA